MEQVEDRIRDELSTRLDLLESGLRLIKTEQFLPNPRGTRGFVDLFAGDKAGKYVLIELKRSAASSREALHEILKYLEALKVSYSARDAEIRIFIVSTDWSELLVPFSSFVKRTSCEVVGFALEVDSDNVPKRATLVSPLVLAEDRLFSQCHDLNLYETLESLNDGLRSYEYSCKEKGILNYVLIIMEPPPGHHQRTVEATRNYLKGLQGPGGNFSDREVGLDFEKLMPEHRYLMYFAPLVLSEELCLNVIRNSASGDDLEEFEEAISDMEGDERISFLHHKIYELAPETKRDHLELGYPAKFASLFDAEGWKVTKIHRYGTLKANQALTDEAIINDLKGDDGNNLRQYRRKFDPSNKTEVEEVINGTKRCLRDNPLWRNQILRVLYDLLPNEQNITANLFIYNPAHFCLSIYRLITQEDGIRYLPCYILTFEKEGKPFDSIFGVMQPNGNTPSFTKLLSNYYDGLPIGLLQSLSWGGYESEDVQIARDLGMTYKTFKMEIKGDNQCFWELTEMGWDSHAPVSLTSAFHKYVEDNQNFISDIVEFYSSHWDGIMWSYDENGQSEFRT